MKARFYRYYHPPGRLCRWMTRNEENMPWIKAAFWAALAALVVIVSAIIKGGST